ncbi:MAG: hypothetical protein R3F20_13560 [Planctomycetota bacterium]
MRLLGESATLALYLGEADRAEEIFRAIEILAPEEPVAFHGLAELALARGEAEEARRAARLAQGAFRADASGVALGLVLEARGWLLEGARAEALACLARAENLDPAGPGAAMASALAHELAVLDETAGSEVKR